MTTVILRLCVKGFFEHHSYIKITVFWKESERENENVWDDCTFSAPRNPVSDLFVLSQLRSF